MVERNRCFQTDQEKSSNKWEYLTLLQFKCFSPALWPKIGREDRGLDKLNRIPLHVQKENSNVTEFTNLLQSHLPFDELWHIIPYVHDI